MRAASAQPEPPASETMQRLCAPPWLGSSDWAQVATATALLARQAHTPAH